MSLLAQIIGRIEPPDEHARAKARRREATLAKPPGSLGRLEELAIQLAGIRGKIAPIDRPAIIVMAADHGVAAEGVSAYPASVTVEMVRTFLAGGAAINVIAQVVGARVLVVDMGTASPLAHPDLRSRRIGAGTRNLAERPAMSRADARRGVEAGIEIALDLAAAGVDLVVPGDMGIANTTAAACLVAALTGASATSVAGRGTGVDDAGLSRKLAVIERALARHVATDDALATLADLGGHEIAGLAGVCLGAASRRIPVVLDGVISTAAALVAAALTDRVRPYLIAGHRSVEPAHAIALAALRLEPLLHLDMRLGEGSGAALAIPIVRSAAATLALMASLESVVSGETTAPPGG